MTKGPCWAVVECGGIAGEAGVGGYDGDDATGEEALVEKRAAVAGVIRLIPPERSSAAVSTAEVGVEVGVNGPKALTASQAFA